MTELIYEVDTFDKVYNLISNSLDIQLDKYDFQLCRFCGENNPDKFKSVAHIIPELTGNKELKYFNECDNCNNKFSKYENDLQLFGGIKNILAGIKGKKYPKHKDYKHYFQAYNSKNGVIFKSLKETGALDFSDEKISIKSETQKFKPRYIQKAFVKIALSLLPKNELKKLTKTIEWLNNPNDDFTPSNHPMFLLIERENNIPLRKPLALVYKRINDSNSPEFTLVFHYSFFSYQLFIPFNENDENLDYSKLILPLNPGVITDNKNFKEVAFNHYYMTTLKKSRLTDYFDRLTK
ncbi:hypothetical protein Lupro_02940 [Lutibacter profundi]|uniref:HNH endonuclease 5 domain-containing protein n=2 Tax=Lutibacter profundi TaxID=1622118 RepID=A0A0X8G567_9FLAO|nr:hypothetical protein Lupro_02940 [Lutibacter profundi]